MKADNELINLLVENGSTKEPDLLRLYIGLKPKTSVNDFDIAISILLEKRIIDYILLNTKFGIEKFFFLTTKASISLSKKFKIVI